MLFFNLFIFENGYFKTRHYTSSSSSRFRRLATRPRPVTAAKAPRSTDDLEASVPVFGNCCLDLPADSDALVDADSEADVLADSDALVDADSDALVLADSDALVDADSDALVLADWLALVDADSEALVLADWLALVDAD